MKDEIHSQDHTFVDLAHTHARAQVFWTSSPGAFLFLPLFPWQQYKVWLTPISPIHISMSLLYIPSHDSHLRPSLSLSLSLSETHVCVHSLDSTLFCSRVFNGGYLVVNLLSKHTFLLCLLPCLSACLTVACLSVSWPWQSTCLPPDCDGVSFEVIHPSQPTHPPTV